MKRKRIVPLLMFGLFFCHPWSALAQVTITKTSTPAAGDNIIYDQTGAGVDVSHTGPNTTWDYSNVIPSSQDSYKFMAPLKINIAYAAAFSGDIGLDLKNPSLKGMYAFFKSSSADFRQEGLGLTIPVINISTPIMYSAPDIQYRFPLNYGDKDSCLYGVKTTLAGTAKVIIKGKRVNTVDGWGKITTPYKTYDCLRVRSEVTELDTFAGIPANNSRIEYKWLAVNEQIPVMQANVIWDSLKDSSMHIFFRDSYKDIMDPNNGPLVDFNANDTIVQTHDTVKLHDVSVGLTSWLWTILPSTYRFVGGTSASSQNPEVLFADTGKYSVSLCGNSGNTRLKINYISVGHDAGIESTNDKANALILYPNPANGYLTLQLPNSVSGSSHRLTMVSATGDVVYSQDINDMSHGLTIPVAQYAPGLYLVQVQGLDGKYSAKVMLR